MSAAPPSTVTRRQFLAAGAGLAAVSVYGASSNTLDVTHESLTPSSPGGRRVRVALITDMHGPHNWIGHQELTDQVNQFRPDLVCIAGDAVDDRGDEPLVARYASLQARLGKFATLGNWEYQGECDLRRLRREYERAGVRLLVNDRVRLDDPAGPIDLLGLDDWRAGAPDYAQVTALPRAAPGATRAIVMSHCPVAFDAIMKIAQRPAVVLAGHTHAGQIAPLGLALVLPEGSGRYVRGRYTSPDAQHTLYVSRGLGNSGPPFRIGARPELALLEI
jgi:uncharacterized protein